VLSRLSVILLLPALLPKLLPAEDRWIALKSGPFEAYSSVGERPAREKLMYLEQFRETLRVITGKEEMRLVWPVHLIIFKSAAEIPSAPKQWKLGRDARMAAIAESGEFSRDSLKELARLMLYENTSRLPPSVEQGLIALVSTVQIDGPKITLGAPVPEAERSPGWALRSTRAARALCFRISNKAATLTPLATTPSKRAPRKSSSRPTPL